MVRLGFQELECHPSGAERGAARCHGGARLHAGTALARGPRLLGRGALDWPGAIQDGHDSDSLLPAS
jgi:hypothetical protein